MELLSKLIFDNFLVGRVRYNSYHLREHDVTSNIQTLVIESYSWSAPVGLCWIVVSLTIITRLRILYKPNHVCSKINTTETSYLNISKKGMNNDRGEDIPYKREEITQCVRPSLGPSVANLNNKYMQKEWK